MTKKYFGFEVSNNDNTIDPKDLAGRIDELVFEQESYQEEHGLSEYEGWEKSEEGSKWYEWDESSDGEELHKLQEFVDSFYGDVLLCNQILKESYLPDYAEEYLRGSMEIPDELEGFIDWDGYADTFRIDFTSGDFDGETYLARG